ncbi:hypothetical protein J7L67_10105 [bacterium]|nr:hypothetical protein [bacterium]
MLNSYKVESDKNIRNNFNSLFSHINRFYLGSLSGDKLDKINTSQLPYGAMVYDRTHHCVKVLTEQTGVKVWKSLDFS